MTVSLSNITEKTTALFVSGHPGAVEWARRRNIKAKHVVHLDLSEVHPGMRVIGTLPAHLIWEVCIRGATFYHLAMDARSPDRHRELPADEMEVLNARLMRVEVRILENPADPMQEEKDNA